MTHLSLKLYLQEMASRNKTQKERMTKKPKETRPEEKNDHQCCMWLDDVNDALPSHKVKPT
jgi:hypothetical protein